MRVTIVTYQGYDGAGVLHAHAFANELIQLGHEVLVLLCGSLETARVLANQPKYLVREVRFEDGALEAPLTRLVDSFAPEIIHLWTPRHLPARVGLEAWSRSDARLIIHYEDDEEFILSEVGSNSSFCEDDLALYRFVRERSYEEMDLEHWAASLNLDFVRETVVEPHLWPWIHPLVTPLVEKIACGFTSISPAYGRFLSKHWSRPIRTLYPGVEFERFAVGHKDPDLEGALGLEGRTVLLYSGSIAAFHDFTDFLLGLSGMIAAYPEIMVVQLGHNYIPEVTTKLLEEHGLSEHVVFAGPIPHSQMPRYLGLADLFLGVAAASEFNAHRLPSKIPEYMAVGKPIILSDIGVANELEDGAEVIKLVGDSRLEIEAGLRRAMELRPTWPTMGHRLKDKAKELFDWNRNAEHLASYYQELLDVEDTVLPEGFDPRIVATRPPVPSGHAPPVREAPAGKEGPRVLVITEGRVGARMSGIGIRYAELSRSLGREFPVVLAHQGSSEMTIPGVRQLRWTPTDQSALLEEADSADVVLVHSYLLQKIPGLSNLQSLLIVDLYCPFIFENIEIHRDRGLPLDERETIHDNDLKVLNEQLLRGDHFLAANDRQRDWILGALTALGRLRPSTSGPGTGPEGFVTLVPFGLSGHSATSEDSPAAVMRGVWPGVNEDDIVLLWGGGIWSWLDPLTPVRAMAEIARTRSDIKLVFLSTRTAEEVIDMPILRELFDLVDQNEGLENVVIFNTDSFVGYEQRSAYFSEADVGICAHYHSLESHFAFRTRALDYLNFGLPMLVTDDDYFGDLVKRHGLGQALPPGDVDAWVAAILEFADSTARVRARDSILEIRDRFLWSRATQGLISFIRQSGTPRLHGYRTGHLGRTESAIELDLPEYSELPLARLFDLAFESLRSLAPAMSRAPIGAGHQELILHTQRLEDELESLRGHAARLEKKVDLLKKFPFARTIWRLLSRSTMST